MTELDQPGADEAPEQESLATEPEASSSEPADSQEPQSESELEKVASAMGWRPDGGAKTAADYIRDTADINRSLKQRIERQEQEFNSRTQNLERVTVAALKRQRDDLWRQYEAAKETAVDLGDRENYRKLNQDQSQAIRRFDEEIPMAAPQAASQQQQAPPPEVAEFATRNSWYMTDKVKTAAAIVMLDEVDQKFPNFALADRLKMVEREMSESFPDLKRSNGQSSGPPSVEGGLRQIRTNRGKGFNELPPEAKSAAKVFINQGVFKTADDYAKAYWKENQE
jgi:hypothetical protein